MATRRKIVTVDIAEDGADVVYVLHGPADADGKFPVVDELTFNVTSIPTERLNWFALHGVSQILSNRWNRMDEDATPADVRAALSEILTSIFDNTWTPGRTFAEREPTDLEMAISEATGQPVRDVMDRIENEYERDDDGSYKLTANGRKSKVFNKRMLDALANDAKIKPILARLVAERAKRLAADAKRGGGSDLLASMFANTDTAPSSVEPAEEQEAAAN